ncbi:unnamed protein product [Prunus armeniaca]
MADRKTEFQTSLSSMYTDIAKLQASVAMLINHVKVSTTNPSSTTTVLIIDRDSIVAVQLFNMHETILFHSLLV